MSLPLAPDAATASSGSPLPPDATAADLPLLDIEDLRVTFHTERGPVHAVQGVSLHVNPGETLGVVGESGSGKSITAMSVLGLLPVNGEIVGGEIRWRGEPVDPRRSRRIRGSAVTMVSQDPMASLNPLVPVGRQVTEVLRKHKRMSRQQAHARAVELFEMVGIPEPRRRMKQFPYEFSGGMAQRVMITMALAPEPDLIIADEPTTALDVTIQAQILGLISDLQRETGVAMLLITHDLGVVASVTDRVTVMYSGRVVEEGASNEIFAGPQHPYTRGLLASTPHPYEVREQLEPIAGSPPAVPRVVPGCAFADRCPNAMPRCDEERPELTPAGDGAAGVGVARGDGGGQARLDGVGDRVGGLRRRAACWFPMGG